MTSAHCLNDGAFGPSVHGCRDDFDFTQKFERIIFSIVPASVFLALASARVLYLIRKPRLNPASVLQFAKLLSIGIYAATQIALLAVVISDDSAVAHGLFIAGAALSVLAGLLLAILSFLEHSKSPRSSALVNVYLLLTLTFDIAQSRTLWLAIHSHRQATTAHLFTASTVVKLAVLILEAQGKPTRVNGHLTIGSPEEASGIYSLSTYYWLRSLFLRGFRGILLFDDLYGLDGALSAERAATKLTIQRESLGRQGSNLLLKALFVAFAWPILLPILPQLALIAFQFSQSFFLRALVQYLDLTDQDRSKNTGYGLIAACALVYLGTAISTSYASYYRERAVAMTRACLGSAIYKKTTEITTTAAAEKAAVTLMSTDVEYVQVGMRLLQTMWSSVIQVSLGFWLLYTQLGVSFVIPIVIISICSGVLLWTMTFVKKLQSVWMGKIQDRVSSTVSAISNMKTFKMLGISDHVAETIQELREGEIHAGTRFRLTIFAAVTLSYIPLSASPALTFALTFRNLNPATFFMSLSFLTLLTTPLLHLFQGLPRCLAALASLRRIEEYLNMESRDDFRRLGFQRGSDGHGSNEKYHSIDMDSGSAVHEPETAAVNANCNEDLSIHGATAFIISQGSFGWSEEKTVLRNLDIQFPRGKISMVIGPTASGKSTLCQVLLGEVTRATGQSTTPFINDAIAYCAQTPFLTDASIRENIVQHFEFDEKLYNAVTAATMLEVDVVSMPLGHSTKVGSNGNNLSGGQRQRLALARALYARSEMVILDDVLSGLDAATEAEVLDRVFGPSGIIRQRGSTAIISMHSSRHISCADHVIVLGTDGKVIEHGPRQQLVDRKEVLDLKSFAVDGERSQKEEEKDSQKDSSVSPDKETSLIPLTELFDQSRRNGDWAVYVHYMRQITPWIVFAFASFCLLTGTATNFATVWISYWSADEFQNSRAFYAGIYGLVRAMELLGVLGTAIVGLTDMVSSSGLSLHRQTFTTVMKAPLSLFTSTNTGTVTNLFSQDMTLIDGELPISLLNTSVSLMVLIGNLFVAAIASPYLAVSYPFLIGLLYFIQMFYLRTSRQLRLLDLEAKSPLYNHFIETCSGLSTIRAFKWTRSEIKKNNGLLNSSQRPAYLLTMIQAWLQTTLTLLVGIIAVCLTALATQLKTSSSFTGASLITLMSLVNVITSLMESYTRLETSIGAVNRLKTFSQGVRKEDSGDESMPVLEQWPPHGAVSVKQLSASYSEASSLDDEKLNQEPAHPLALNNISFSIRPGEKVAICGRTGSGKSSLVLALLRFLDPLSGSGDIQIDETTIFQVERSTLRQRLIVVPQEAVFLPGKNTIKSNIDPSGTATNEECLSVLEEVQLSKFIEDNGGLHEQLRTDNLSAGQQQLFGLGRAVLRRKLRDRVPGSDGGVLLLDEMNSRLDEETERITQELVRTYFSDYTVIMIAHRLDMVMQMCDRVLILDKGRLVEEGDPKLLAESSGTWFAELWARRT